LIVRDRFLAGLPGSSRQFAHASIVERGSAIDWFPQSHEPMPAVVAEPRGPVQTACGYCHLPDGAGRPENAKLAGLPQAYIISELTQMRAHDRDSAQAGYLPMSLMRSSIDGLTPEEIQAAATYFEHQRAKSFETVIEATRVPASAARCFMLVRSDGVARPLGDRIVEFADQPDRFELRDPRTTYTENVPPGSFQRGGALVSRGRGALAACSSCHGVDLRGGKGLAGPPLAGRFAGYLVRQLYGFRSGARHGAAAQPMQAVAAELSDRDIIDAGAYAASLRP
jgi:cytochrome c553